MTPFLVALVPLTIGLVVYFFIAKARRSFERSAEHVRELPTRGIRRRGRVRDAVPYGSPSGGAVFQAEGAQMVLRVALEPEAGAAGSMITIHVVEDSERSRARIGTEVTILEHPEDPLLRALEGFLPNGRPAG